MGRIKSVRLVKTVYTDRDEFPDSKRGDVAFVGRSNVGKSTLLNILFGKKLAHVSKKPGKTRSINFYLVNSSFYMVDLPGYGYAKVSKSERLRWERLVSRYFKERENLKMLFILVDGRHELQKTDREFLEWIRDYEVPFVIVMTKMDKVKKNERKKKVEDMKRELMKYGEYTVIPYSSVTKDGVEEILKISFNSVGVRS